MKFGTVATVLLMFLLICCRSSWADVVLIDTAGQPLPAEHRLERACQFYGLKIAHINISEGEDWFAISSTLNQHHSQAIVIAGRALVGVDVNDVMSVLAGNREKRAFVLVLGLTPEMDSGVLSKWSQGAVVGCASARWLSPPGVYSVSALGKVSRQLAGLEFPITGEKVDYLVLDKRHNVQTIVELRNSNEGAEFPIFVKTVDDQKDVFFLAQDQLSKSSGESSRQFNVERFLEIAPLMMFLRYACGERCWHSVGHFANLTIDDPWLTEPYGHLNYKGLLEQMDKANFHTTIAFIPWNYDRNEMDVISLFKERTDRFSICIHGNDHDHYEFYKQQTNIMDFRLAKPLNIQEVNIKQAIARMEKFKDITGLSYDPVMVFPHGIAPAKTLGLLKKYNFVATSNGGNVPLDSDEPNDPLYSLRPVTVDFENFASFDRDYVEARSKADVAIDLFLGNPILLYDHHDFFKHGIDAFNETAEMVNRIEPTTEWHSLGYIARHLYLERVRDDGGYDVRAFCRSVDLENTQRHDVTYFVRKAESFCPPIRLMTVDGEPYPYKTSDSDISLTITIPAGEFRAIDIEYQNDLDLTSIDVSKSDPRVNRLRKLSDFRDITLSRNLFGRAFIYVYYKIGFHKLSLKRLAIISSVLAVAICLTCWYSLRHIRKYWRQRADIDKR